MTQNEKELLLKDICERLPYKVKAQIPDEHGGYVSTIESIDLDGFISDFESARTEIEYVKPYLFPLSSMTDEDYAIYSKIWEDTGKQAYLDGYHHLICTIKAYKGANNYLLSKHYDINGLIPLGLGIDATGKNIY